MVLLIRIAAALLLATQLAASSAAQPASVAADDVKAAFLYNFAKYVEWPVAATGGSFRLCVVAEPGFLKRIDNLIAGETIEGRPVMRDSPAVADARGCQILYVGASEKTRGERLIAAVRGAPVLTVGDTNDFLARGGMIAFVREGDRMRFDVDNGAAQSAGLTISSRVLRLARHLGSQEPRP
jgi:hypothetical protein